MTSWARRTIGKHTEPQHGLKLNAREASFNTTHIRRSLVSTQHRIRILHVTDLRLANDKKKVEDRKYALDIAELNIFSAMITLVLGDQGAGKSPLGQVIDQIMHKTHADNESLAVGQVETAASWDFRHLSGNPNDFERLSEPNTLFYCDDPNHNHVPTGSQAIEKATEYRSALVLAPDPERLEGVLTHFIERTEGRTILWLDAGRELCQEPSVNCSVFGFWFSLRSETAVVVVWEC